MARARRIIYSVIHGFDFDNVRKYASAVKSSCEKLHCNISETGLLHAETINDHSHNERIQNVSRHISKLFFLTCFSVGLM